MGQSGDWDVGVSILWLVIGLSISCLGGGWFNMVIGKWVWSIWLLGSTWG